MRRRCVVETFDHFSGYVRSRGVIIALSRIGAGVFEGVP